MEELELLPLGHKPVGRVIDQGVHPSHLDERIGDCPRFGRSTCSLSLFEWCRLLPGARWLGKQFLGRQLTRSPRSRGGGATLRATRGLPWSASPRSPGKQTAGARGLRPLGCLLRYAWSWRRWWGGGCGTFRKGAVVAAGHGCCCGPLRRRRLILWG